MNKPIPTLSKNEIARFWSNVNIQGEDQCWEWQKFRMPNDERGQVRIQGETYLSNRVAWFLYNKRQPGDLMVCHSCDNPPCCNPKHLFLGTALDNTTDSIKKGRATVFMAGEGHTNAKLSDEEVEQIKRLYRLGYKQSQLATKFKVHQSQISRIVRGNRR